MAAHWAPKAISVAAGNFAQQPAANWQRIGSELEEHAAKDDATVHIAHAEFDQVRPDVVVGSSRGGAVGITLSSSETTWTSLPLSRLKFRRSWRRP